jgi:hypothetical protein
MIKPLIRIHNIETDEIIDREMTDAEHSAWLDQKAKDAIETTEKEQSQANKEALLAKLGITAEEAALLLG